MKYTSTRNSSLICSFEDAICSGYSPDGGLFVPCSLPTIDSQILQSWSSLTYPDLAFEVMRMFIAYEEISDVDLQKICHESFVKGFLEDNCCGGNNDTIPVKKLGSGYIVELYHGPTFCFKDLGMRAVINILSYFASKRETKITLIVSTTGDTGPAAVQAVCDAKNPLLNILVHYPLGQISSFQRKQLTTVYSPNVKVATFEGGGDDMDAPIKRMLAASSSNEDERNIIGTQKLCGVNSYNIGRPMVQMVHFIWTYLRVVEAIGVEPGDKGAMGNIAGGYMAKKMGLPIGKLCAGVNVNDISHRVIKSGKFHKSDKMEKTLSDAINIQVPYNFERLLFYLTDGNHELVKWWMSNMEETSKLDLDDSWLKRLQDQFSSARITDDEMCVSMKRVFDKFNYFIDPHTAVGTAAADKLGYDLYDMNYKGSPYAILSTASPCKFEESVSTGIGQTNWNTYVETQFPPRAAAILDKTEIDPILYKWIEGKSLDEMQVEWERIARSLFVKF